MFPRFLHRLQYLILLLVSLLTTSLSYANEGVDSVGSNDSIEIIALPEDTLEQIEVSDIILAEEPVFSKAPFELDTSSETGMMILGILMLFGGIVLMVGMRSRRWLPGMVAVLGGVFLYQSLFPLFPATQYPIPALNQPPVQQDSVDVKGGKVRVGKTDVTTATGEIRPYFWIWLDENGPKVCGENGTYRWYQFVNSRFYINNKKRKVSTIKGATGLVYRFDKWNPDYHLGEPGTEGPDFSPGDLKLPKKKPGKPFKPYDIPGTSTVGGTSHKTGLLDAPDFTDGPENVTPIERLFKRFVKDANKRIESKNQPPTTLRDLRVETDVRSYLVCIKDGKITCVGYYEWTYTNNARIEVYYKNTGGVAAGMGIKVWKQFTRIIRRSHDLNLKGWKKC